MEYGFSSQVHIPSVLCVWQITWFSYLDEGAWASCFFYVVDGL